MGVVYCRRSTHIRESPRVRSGPGRTLLDDRSSRFEDLITEVAVLPGMGVGRRKGYGCRRSGRLNGQGGRTSGPARGLRRRVGSSDRSGTDGRRRGRRVPRSRYVRSHMPIRFCHTLPIRLWTWKLNISVRSLASSCSSLRSPTSSGQCRPLPIRASWITRIGYVDLSPG